MIKIIKLGSNEKTRETKTFFCGKCGRVFKADKEVYYLDNYYGFYYKCTCPYCNFNSAYEQE